MPGAKRILLHAGVSGSFMAFPVSFPGALPAVAQQISGMPGSPDATTTIDGHVHLICMVPPKVSISDLMGTVKGRTAIRVFKQFSYLKRKPYWGNHFRANGYCVDTVGLDAEMIRK